MIGLSSQPHMSLKRVLHKFLCGHQPGRKRSTIHASDLTKPDYCPRREALMDLHETPTMPEALTTSQQVTFRIGRDLQAAVVEWLSEIGLLVGDWTCRRCGAEYPFMTRPEMCSECRGQAMTPHEVRFRSEHTGASCGVDLLWRPDPRGLLQAVEIKTIDKDQFKDLKAPLAEHRQRTSTYLHIINDDPRPCAREVDCEQATVLYVSKGGWGVVDPEIARYGTGEKHSPFKEYVVKRSDDGLFPLEKALSLHHWRTTGEEFPPRICESRSSPLARGCLMASECFADSRGNTR